jgi:hypothetical protein
MNKFYIAVDEDGKEFLYDRIPTRESWFGKNFWTTHQDSIKVMLLPKGTVESILGRSLTWADEPVEVKLKVI